MRRLAPTILTQTFIMTASSVFAAAGQWRAMFVGSVVMAVVLVQGLFVGLYIGGSTVDATLGVAWAYSLTTCLAIIGPLHGVLHAIGGRFAARLGATTRSSGRHGRHRHGDDRLRRARPLLEAAPSLGPAGRPGHRNVDRYGGLCGPGLARASLVPAPTAWPLNPEFRCTRRLPAALAIGAFVAGLCERSPRKKHAGLGVDGGSNRQRRGARSDRVLSAAGRTRSGLGKETHRFVLRDNRDNLSQATCRQATLLTNGRRH